MARVDYDQQSAVYDRGRSMPPEAVATWMAAARRHVREKVEGILDLGSGTGRFSVALSETFDARVVAVEPSAGMRSQAASRSRAHVELVAGSAENIPLAEDSCDAAWLSNVIHHFDDLGLAARELRRVLSFGGPVLIRGAFGGRPVASLYRFFPQTQSQVDSFPTISEVIASFEEAGFGSFYDEQVRFLMAESWAEMAKRVRHRADTTLASLSDEDFNQGMERLDAAAASEKGRVYETLDLLVVR